jgi:multidrug efflux system membrane fusion protein
MREYQWFALLLVVSCVGCNRLAPEPLRSPLTEVVVAHPTVREVTDYEEFTGHTDAILSVQIRARVTGYLDKKDFLDGQEVKEGDILYEIDDRPYKAALERAEAQVAQGEAHRGRLDADYKRAYNLFRRAAIGKQEFDMISSNYAEAAAALNASKAQLDNARLNMGFTKVRAPMTGQLSRTLVDPGNLIRQEETVLNDIVSVDKLYVYFDVSADAMERVSSLIEQGRVGGKDSKEVPVEVGTSVDSDRYEDAMKNLRDLREQKKSATEAERLVPLEFPYKGLVNFSENKLDAATGTLRVRGVIVNPTPPVLTPGLFVRVRLPIGDPHPALLIPEDAIGSDQGRSFVYVITPSDEVEYRPVTTGAVFNGVGGSKLRAIKQGIEVSERFIQDSEALRRVRPGSKVAPHLTPPAANLVESRSKTAR